MTSIRADHPARQLVTPELLSQIERNPAGRLDPATWRSLDDSTRAAVISLRNELLADAFQGANDGTLPLDLQAQIRRSPERRLDDAQWATLSPAQQAAVRQLRQELSLNSFDAPSQRREAGGTTNGAGGHFVGNDPVATTSIAEIQGPGERSPLDRQRVVTTGVVTQADDKGFFLQDPKPYVPGQAPAVYVFTGNRPNVKPGDELKVQGYVSEFSRPKDESGSSTTQVMARADGLEILSANNPIPEVLVGAGGVQLSKTSSNRALWETLESARVKLNDVVVTGAPNDIPRFSDMAVVTDGGAGAGLRTAAGGLIRDEHENPAVVGMRMPMNDMPAVNIGARMPKGLSGNVVDRHGKHQVTVFDAPGADNFIPSPVKPEVSTLRSKYPNPEHVLFIGSLNGENKDVQLERQALVANNDVRQIDDDVGSLKLRRMAEQIVTNLASPDIVALQEVQDNDGAELSNDVDATRTWTAIIEEIVKLGGPRYAWVDRPPKNNLEGGQPGGNIRTGFLYDPKRVSVDESSVKRLEDPAFTGARVPLACTFIFKHGGVTEQISLVNVHHSSKRGRPNASEVQVPQAEVINRWAKQNAPKTEQQHLGVLGDRNAYTHEAPMAVETKDDALRLLSLQLPEADRYSTQFGGSSGELDHASVKTSVPVELDLVHFNSDFDERFRSADHDGTLTAWDFRRGTA